LCEHRSFVLIHEEERTNLSTAKRLVIWKVKDILDQLGHGVTADVEEEVLPIFDKEEAVALELL
jgi:hypothetical protein